MCKIVSLSLYFSLSNRFQIISKIKKSTFSIHCKATVLAVDWSKQHPSYVSSGMSWTGYPRYDIGIIKLKRPIDFPSDSNKIAAICLPPEGSSASYTDEDAIVTGWGTLKSGGQQPDALQHVEVGTMPNRQCWNWFTQGYWIYAIRSHMICASNPGKDSCQGDSGGESNPRFILEMQLWMAAVTLIERQSVKKGRCLH